VKIEKVGIIGCGFMGAGIVQVCAQAGYTVKVVETREEILEKGLKSINTFLSRSVAKGAMLPEVREAIMHRISGTIDLRDLHECDLVIEVAPEEINLKKKLFAELDKLCPKKTILCSNTSTISIAELSQATNRPAKVIGTHFLSPVPPSKLLEIVTTPMASDDTIETAKAFGKSLGKEVLVAKDTPGFIFNYLLISLALAAVELLEKGIATKEDIDKSMTLGLGHPIGPLALMDFNGVDVAYLVTQAFYERTKDPHHKPPLIVKQMIEEGRLGRKTGKGFYDYD
jgi:3-hydroxybutyryl-CoA dehydrogenase